MSLPIQVDPAHLVYSYFIFSGSLGSIGLTSTLHGIQQTISDQILIIIGVVSFFQSRGSFIEPSLDLLNGIASGMAHILISTRRMTTGELKGQISLSSSRCSKISKASSNPLLQRSLVGSDLNVGVCLHQGRFYDHGAQWHPLNKDGVSKIYCKICRCNVS